MGMTAVILFLMPIYPAGYLLLFKIMYFSANQYMAVLLIGLLLASCRQEETARRVDYVIHGIDVSHYQARIDWQRLPAQDIQFAFIKATEGENLVDSLYAHNWSQAGAVNIHRGAYHFFRPRSPVMGQVLNFVRQVRLDTGDLPPVLDLETLDGMSPDTVVDLARAWLHLIESHYRVRPILYSNQKFYNRYLDGHFEDHQLWVARYSNELPELGSARTWHFWQYGDRARLEGISGYVDLNVFSGDKESFQKLLISRQDSVGAEPDR